MSDRTYGGDAQQHHHTTPHMLSGRGEPWVLFSSKTHIPKHLQSCFLLVVVSADLVFKAGSCRGTQADLNIPLLSSLS